MTVRRSLLLAFVAGLALVLLAAWLSSIWAWHATSTELRSARLEQVLEAARRMEAGASLEQVERDLSIDLRFEPGSRAGPPRPPGAPPGPYRGDGPWTEIPGRGRGLWANHRDGSVAAYTDGRWILLHDDLVSVTVLRVLGGLLLVLSPLLGLIWWWTERSLRPIDAAQEAMARIAAGEWSHRLDEDEGPAELRSMAGHFNVMADVVQQRLRMERQLMAGVSHELRTPLTRVRMELELARLAGADPTRIDRVDQEVEAIDRLVEELLELSRLEVGSLALEREDTDLAVLARNAASRWPEVEVEGEGHGRVGRRLLTRALENLLSNCERHAPGAAVRVQVSNDGFIVEDEGEGVPNRVRQRLFEPFWRAPEARGDGYGVGMAIVRQIARAHGGDAVVLPGEKGLRVRLTLALGRRAPA